MPESKYGVEDREDLIGRIQGNIKKILNDEVLLDVKLCSPAH